MIKCGECGFSITGENKANRYGSRYTYYHCTKRRLDYRCSQPYLTVDELEQQIIDFLQSISISDGFTSCFETREATRRRAQRNHKATELLDGKARLDVMRH